MRTTKRLVIDIGTNSVLALLVELRGDGMNVLFDRQRTTRLGEGLQDTGGLFEDAMRRTADAIKAFVKDAEFDSAVLIGTEALRVASNSAEFADLVEQETGYRPVVISGRQEAEFTFLGAKLDLISEEMTVVDVGGGSTEIIRGKGERIIDAESIPIGALHLRKHVPVDRISAYKEYAAGIMGNHAIFDSRMSVKSIIGVGGTITSLAALAIGLDEYDPRAVHGYRLSAGKLESVAGRFEGITQEERRKLIPFDPLRADLILPGTGIFLALMGIMNMNQTIVSSGGLRFGVALFPEKML